MNNPTRTLWALCLLTLITLAGCADLQGAIAQTTTWRNNAQEIETDLQNKVITLESKRETAPIGSPSVVHLNVAIAQANAKINALNAAIMQADLVIAEATNPTDSLTRAANALSPWIPAPAQGPMVLGAALIATLFRSRNLKNSAASIIQSIEHTMNRDPEFKQLFNQHADTIRTIQTPGARKLIDTTIRKSKKPSVLV